MPFTRKAGEGRPGGKAVNSQPLPRFSPLSPCGRGAGERGYHQRKPFTRKAGEGRPGGKAAGVML